MNIPVAPLSKSTFTITPSWVSIFSIPIFNHTSLSISKVCLTSLCLPFSFAVPSRAPAHALLYCTFPLLGHTISVSFLFWHPHYFCLSEITPCSLFSSTWHPFHLYLSHSTYNTITFFVYHPSSNRHALSRVPSPQCSCAFHHLLLPYYPLFHITLYYPTWQHFKFILGSSSPLLLSFLIPAILGQVPEPFATSTFLFFFFF